MLLRLTGTVFLIFCSFIVLVNDTKKTEAAPPPALDGMFIINEDNSHFYASRTPEQMTLENLTAFVDQYAGTKVTHLFLCPNAQRASFQSRSRDAIWAPVNGAEPEPKEKWMQNWVQNTKRLDEQGLDPYKIWIDRCHEKKISPWISMRMNDMHGVHQADNFQNSAFWRTHPQFWRSDRAFNYAHSEVREYKLAFISELFERYDFDGLELDWLRSPSHLTPGKEREESIILNEFMRSVRKLAKEWEQKRGHPIYLAARIPTDPDNAAGLGMDAVQWAKEGSVDLLIPSPFYATVDMDIPVEKWLDKIGKDVALASGIDRNITAYPGGDGWFCLDLAMLYGFVSAEHFHGAKNIYLFNWMDGQFGPSNLHGSAVSASDYRTLLEKGLNDDIVLHSVRRHPISYRDIVSSGGSNNIQLPRQTDKESSLTIQLGPKPAAGKLWLILGLAANDSVKDAVLSATLNGKKTEPTTDEELKGFNSGVVRALRFDCPLDTAQNGTNTVSVRQESGSPQKIVWVELRVEP